MAQPTLTWLNTRRVMSQFGEAFAQTYVDALGQRGVNASHALADSVRYTVAVESGNIAVDVSLLEYWKYVEYGRRAGGKMPPLSVIEEWIRVKPVHALPRPRRIGSNKTYIPSPRSLAYLIARKISRDGIKPRPLFADSLDAVWVKFEQALSDAITLDVMADVDIVLADLR